VAINSTQSPQQQQISLMDIALAGAVVAVAVVVIFILVYNSCRQKHDPVAPYQTITEP
jgi:Na+/serine symporter